ncbi:NAD-dependent epimerase/dehydratase family protein [Streptomyces indicus]|uniref:Nucleoside-diphosphate-sugar epimerase n=1 Tax=Streptomyces indicus TaxID=417292 RepID=A0A1G8XBA2_9ACTN|nr:NAD(P)-dependent oxidoreductase [Streptomyces indicus]SDJ87165.1 Nucleoside-diphosphate-sugar epimerase [Streptomyces indicus]
MRVLLLGSSGFIGRHTAERLRALPGVRLLIGGRRPDADVTLDLTADVERLTDALYAAAPDAVVNCVGLVAGSAVRLTDVNARGPAALCEALGEAAPAARLVHLGSAAEYGPTEPGTPVTEHVPTRPQGPYGATKLAGTVAITASRLDAVVLRVFNPVGPGASAESLPGRLARELLRAGPGGPVQVGDLSAYRDFVDVRDVAEAVALAVRTSAQPPPVLNIGSGRPTPARVLAAQLADIAGYMGPIEESAPGSGRSAAVSWSCADITAARDALGWEPRRSLADSLTDHWRALAPVLR